MNKVEMMIFGKLALVDADQVKKLTRKQELVARARELQKCDPNSPELTATVGKIIRLNRTIRQNVQFI